MKEVNNLAELQDFVEKNTDDEYTKYMTIDLHNINKYLETVSWSEKPHFHNGVWMSGRGLQRVEKAEGLKLNFEPDWSECIFEVVKEYDLAFYM